MKWKVYIYIFIMKNKQFLSIVCRMCTFNCRIDIFNVNNVDRRRTCYFTKGDALRHGSFPKEIFNEKVFFPVHSHAYACTIVLRFIVTRYCYSQFIFIEKRNRYSLVDEATPLEIGTKKQHSITLFKYKTISSFITIIIAFSLSSLSNLNFPWRTTCALINFFITTPVPCFSLLGFLLEQKKNKKKKTRSGGNSGLGDYL